MKIVLNVPDLVLWPFVPLVLLYRRLRYGYAFRRIRLTYGKYAIVDPGDFKELSMHQWCTKDEGTRSYAVRVPAAAESSRGLFVSMHREIMAAPAAMFVDHIDHRGLHNRRANLRLATPSQNGQPNNCSPSTPSIRIYAAGTVIRKMMIDPAAAVLSSYA